MGFPIGKVLGFALRALGAIQTAVPAVEAAAKTFKGGGTGAEKKAAVMDVVRANLQAAELVTGVDLANDADVLEAAGKVNDAYVALLKVIARKAAPAEA